MRKKFEDIYTFLIAIIGFFGGLTWAVNSNWDYEPVILLSVSSVGIIVILLINLFSEDIRPIVELELKSTRSFRSSVMMAQGLSPQNDEGFYLHETDGIYHYEFEHSYDIIIRNNSNNIAYNVGIYVENKYFLKYYNEESSLDPLTINNPKVMKMIYNFSRNCTSKESEDELSIIFNEQLKSTQFIVEYQDEKRKTFYTIFNPPNNNSIQNKKIKFNKIKYRKIF